MDRELARVSIGENKAWVSRGCPCEHAQMVVHIGLELRWTVIPILI
jgi:hypothetical protein